MRRQAAVAFRGAEKYKETGRDARGLRWLGGLTLDVRLGGRMLVKFSGLTIVGGAPPAVVLGHDVWRVRFAGDSAIVG